MGVLMIRALQLKAAALQGYPHVGAELVSQALGDGERAAHAAGDILILTDAENGGVPAHLFSDSAFQRVSDRHHSHGIQPSQNTCSNAELSSGSGAALAYSTASSISSCSLSVIGKYITSLLGKFRSRTAHPLAYNTVAFSPR